MYNIVLKLGMISAVDPQSKTLNIIDLSNFITKNLTDMPYMLYNCNSLLF